jgi:hypothetical protein
MDTSRMLSEPINPTMLNGYLFFTRKSNGTLDSDQLCDLNKSDVKASVFTVKKKQINIKVLLFKFHATPGYWYYLLSSSKPSHM